MSGEVPEERPSPAVDNGVWDEDEGTGLVGGVVLLPEVEQKPLCETGSAASHIEMESLQLSSESSSGSIVVVKEWPLEPISKVEVNESTDDTFILLQHLGSKPHIGPKLSSLRSRPLSAIERTQAMIGLRQQIAARKLQRWYRSMRMRRPEGPSEMRSVIACECGCQLV